MDRILISPENRMLESFSGDFAMFGGAVDPAVAVKFSEAEEARDAAESASAPLSQNTSLSPPEALAGEVRPAPQAEPAEDATGSVLPSFVASPPEMIARASSPQAREAETLPIQADNTASSLQSNLANATPARPASGEEAASEVAPNSGQAAAAPAQSQPATPLDIAPAEAIAPVVASAAPLTAPVLEPVEGTLAAVGSTITAVPAAAVDTVAGVIGSTLDAAALENVSQPVASTLDALPLDSVTEPVASVVGATPVPGIVDDLTGLGGSDPAGGIETLIGMVSAGEILGAEEAGEATSNGVETVVDPVLLALSDEQPGDHSDAGDDGPVDLGIDLPVDDDLGGIL